MFLCVICYGKSRVGGDSVESFKVCSLPPNQTYSEQKTGLNVQNQVLLFAADRDKVMSVRPIHPVRLALWNPKRFFIDSGIYRLQIPVSTVCRCPYLLFVDACIYCLQMPVSSVYRCLYLVFIDACIQHLQMPVSSVYRCLYLVFVDTRIQCLQMPVSTVCRQRYLVFVLTQFIPLPCKKAFDSSCRRR